MTDLFSWTRMNRQRSEQLGQAPKCDLSRSQVVDQILSINQSASVEYLAQFEQKSLDTYLEHLLSSQQPRGKHARWDRPGDAPAIMVRRRLA